MLTYLVVIFSLILSLVLAVAPAYAQIPNGVLLNQRPNGQVEPLTPEQQASLGDPFFNLVLKEHADVTSLAEVLDLIQPQPNQRETFVVDEKIADSTRGQSRRAVLAFTGSNGQPLTSNVMLSVSFNSERFPNSQPIEGWGWDSQRGRYNYYKLDRTGTPGRFSWKFRGSSDGADLLSPQARQGSCMQCHINGAPIMKELFRPWNNWDSLDFRALYLRPDFRDSWLVASNDIVQHLKGAETLELSILPAITQFNRQKVLRSFVRDSNGMGQVVEGKRLLKPLFVTTEYNIISSDRQKSGLHPFHSVTSDSPSEKVNIPNSFFLNANLISGGTTARYRGLGISQSQSFKDITDVTHQEYKDLITESGVQLGGQPGDAVFAWFVPEPSHVDNDLIDQLMKQGVVTPEFIAAVMAIDLETPVLSAKRQELLDLIPDEFRFQPLPPGADPLTQKRHPDELTQSVIATLESQNPSSDSTAGEFLAILKSDNPIEVLRERVQAYRTNLDSKLNSSNPEIRKAELKRLYDVAIARRQAIQDDQTLSPLNETGDLLFPVPPENQSVSFVTP
jgi:hypothetical protein